MLAEFVHSTENFSIFVVSNRKACFFLIFCFSIVKTRKLLVITFSFSDKVINKVIPNSRMSCIDLGRLECAKGTQSY